MNENKVFDDKIREALGHIKSGYKPESWDLMEQRLNQVPKPIISVEEQFDTIIREKVAKNTKPTYNPTHWAQMSDKLDEYFSLAAWVHRNRVAEIGLTVLFIFTCINIFHTPYSIENNPTSVASFSQDSNIIFSTEKMNNKGFDKNITADKNTLSSEKNSGANSTNRSSGSNTSDALSVSYAALMSYKNVIPTIFTQNVSLLEIPKYHFQVSPIESIKQQLILAEKRLSIEKMATQAVVEVAKKKRFEKRIGMLAIVDANYIVTPDDNFFASYIPEYAQWRKGYGGGFTLGLKGKRFAAETGFFYNAKEYTPTGLTIQRGSISTGVYNEALSNIQINTVQIPLNFNYDLVQRNKWSIYTHLGLTTNFITQANYDNSRQFIAYRLRPAPPSEPSAIEQTKTFQDGIFEGGLIRSNVFFSANMGFGAEYRMTRKIAVFTQAAYLQNLTIKGIGPNNDKISSFSTWMGLKTSF